MRYLPRGAGRLENRYVRRGRYRWGPPTGGRRIINEGGGLPLPGDVSWEPPPAWDPVPPADPAVRMAALMARVDAALERVRAIESTD